MVALFGLSACGNDSAEEAEEVRDVSLNQSFTMEPGETVRFTDPFEYRLTLTGFEDFIKQENTLATATAKFIYTISNGFGDLILFVTQDQGDEGPVSFFSGCSTGILSDGGSNQLDVFYIVDEVSFEEDATKFRFNKIRFKVVLQETNTNPLCTN